MTQLIRHPLATFLLRVRGEFVRDGQWRYLLQDPMCRRRLNIDPVKLAIAKTVLVMRNFFKCSFAFVTVFRSGLDGQ